MSDYICGTCRQPAKPKLEYVGVVADCPNSCVEAPLLVYDDYDQTPFKDWDNRADCRQSMKWNWQIGVDYDTLHVLIGACYGCECDACERGRFWEQMEEGDLPRPITEQEERDLADKIEDDQKWDEVESKL